MPSTNELAVFHRINPRNRRQGVRHLVADGRSSSGVASGYSKDRRRLGCWPARRSSSSAGPLAAGRSARLARAARHRAFVSDHVTAAAEGGRVDAITLAGVTKRFGDVVALDDVSLGFGAHLITSGRPQWGWASRPCWTLAAGRSHVTNGTIQVLGTSPRIDASADVCAVTESQPSSAVLGRRRALRRAPAPTALGPLALTTWSTSSRCVGGRRWANSLADSAVRSASSSRWHHGHRSPSSTSRMSAWTPSLVGSSRPAAQEVVARAENGDLLLPPDRRSPISWIISSSWTGVG